MFENLTYRDKRKDITRKLDRCPRVEAVGSKTMLGRTGLNGFYRTKKTVSGMKFSIYFTWAENNEDLSEVTLRSAGQPSINGKIRSAWNELTAVLSEVYGKATFNNNIASEAELNQAPVIFGALWKTNDGHAVALGVGRDEYGKTLLFLRFMKKQPKLQRKP